MSRCLAVPFRQLLRIYPCSIKFDRALSVLFYGRFDQSSPAKTAVEVFRRSKQRRVNYSAVARECGCTAQHVRSVALGLRTSAPILQRLQEEARRMEGIPLLSVPVPKKGFRRDPNKPPSCQGSGRIVLGPHHGKQSLLRKYGIASWGEMKSAQKQGGADRRVRVALRVLQNIPHWWQPEFGISFDEFQIQALEPFVRTSGVQL